MYAPNSFHIDLFSLWNDISNQSPRILHEHNETKSISDSQTRSNNDRSTIEQRKHMNNLFAPPLSAYSANYPGASSFQLEYTVRTGIHHTNSKLFSITPSTQANIEQLEIIRNTGYNTIRPIGIGKTMEELDFETSGQFTVTDEQSYGGGGVNITGAENSGNANQQDEQDEQDNSNNTLLLGSNLNASGLTFQLEENQEVDLDAHVLNADDLYSQDDEDDDVFEDGDILTDVPEEQNLRYRIQNLQSDSEIDIGYRTNLDDEGFMASEVEYQDDHSLNSEGNTTAYVVNSEGSSSLFNSNNTGRTTNPTTATSLLPGGTSTNNYLHRIHEEIHNENDPGYSELDMVVDES